MQIAHRLREVSPGTIHLWRLDLRRPLARLDAYNILSRDEKQRADGFFHAEDRKAYVATHSWLRIILAEYLDKPPRELSFQHTLNGKPEVALAQNHLRLEFNLSSSRDWAILGVTSHTAIGVDVEFIDRGVATDAMARRFFAPEESRMLLALPIDQRLMAFFKYWTRKEAYIKAVGMGLAMAFDSFVCSGEDEAGMVRAEGGLNAQCDWSIYDVLMPKGYAAAVVVEGTGHRVETMRAGAIASVKRARPVSGSEERSCCNHPTEDTSEDF